MNRPGIYRILQSSRFRPAFLPAVALLLLAAMSVGAQNEIYEGRLGPGDTKLGRFFDTYTLNFDEGVRVVVDLISTDFDSLLLAEAPDGTELENDDYEEDSSSSRLDFIVTVSGEWRVKATSYEDDEQGAYTLKITTERIGQVQSRTGVLAEEDTMALKGEYYDTFPIRVQKNQRIFVELRSDEFDTYLVVKPATGQPLINDDFLSENTSRIEYIAEATGSTQVHVTSFEPAETGSYTLAIVYGEQVDIQTQAGRLDSGDKILPEHGHSDEYYLTLNVGQHIIVELVSADFDTFLRVEKPDGFYEENDDYNDETSISRLEVFAAASGEYRIFAAAYGEGETGSYTLKLINLSGSSSTLRWTAR